MDSRPLYIVGDNGLHVFRHPVKTTNERNGRGALKMITYILGIWRSIRTGEDVSGSRCVEVAMAQIEGSYRNLGQLFLGGHLGHF
jgi:hypothetical protein